MKRIGNLNILVAIILLASVNAFGQDEVVPVSLEKVLELGGANNLTIQEFRQRQDLALADLTTASQWWLPELYAGISTHHLWGAAMNADGRFFTEVGRENFWAGIGLNAAWDFGNGIYSVKAVQLNADAAEFATQAEQNQALLRSINAYYDLMAAQLAYQAYSDLSKQADTIVRQLQIQVDAGIRYQSEVLLARSNYNHLRIEMLNARAEYGLESARLANLLNLGSGVKLVSIDTVLIPLKMDLQEDLDAETAVAARPEMKEARLRLNAIETEKRITTTGLLLPRLRVGTYGSYFGDVFSPLYPTAEVNASLVWRIPTGRLALRGELKQFNARIDLQNNRVEQVKNQINEEVAKAKILLTTSREQIEIAEEATQLAGEALEQSIQRQAFGTAKPFEVLQAQEIYIKARLDYFKAVATHNKAQYALQVAYGNNL